MADPLTVLGAAAAAAQLADQAYSLIKFFSNLYGKIKEAPELTRTRVAHIEQLQSVSNLIKNTNPLQTSEVQAILVACLQTTSDLNKILKKCSPEGRSLLKHTLQSVKAIHKEGRVIVLLDRIEKQKSLLALCIHQLDASQLEALNIEVSEVRTALGNTAIVINDTAAHVQTLVDITPAMADQVQELFTNVPGLLGRIREDLKKIAVSSRPHPNAEASQLEKRITRTNPEFVTAIRKLLNVRLFLWSSIFLVVFAFVRYTYFTESGFQNEMSLRPYEFYEVPSQRVKNFVGRETTLARVKAGLSSTREEAKSYAGREETGAQILARVYSANAPKVVVIRAMGGQGKTQVALEYCRLWRNASDVFWVDATSEGTLKADFALLSYVLEPSTSPTLEAEARVSNVRRALAAQEVPWLMVFDNYDDPQSYNIRRFIPYNKLGMVIVTSRHEDAEFLADPEDRIELTGLKEKDAIELLLLESELDHSDNILAEHATAIVHRLAYHPLAIAQAGAYIRMRDLALDEFMNLYNERQAAILKETTPLMSGYWKRVNESSQEVPMSVFTTCELSYQQLVDLEKAEQRNLPDLLTMLAFFDSRQIPEALIKAYYQSPGQLPCVDANDDVCRQRFEASTKRRPSGLASIGPVRGSGFILHPQDGGWDSSSLYEPTKIRPSKPASAIAFQGPGSFLRQQEESWDSSSFHEAVLVLRQLSLADFSVPSNKSGSLSVSLHPLIRDWLRLRTPRDQCPEYSSLVATCIYKFLVGTRNWAAYQMTLFERQQLIGHISAYAANMADFGAGQPPKAFDIPIYDWGRHTGRPAYQFSKLLYQNGQYKASVEWSRRSLAQRLARFGPDAQETLEAQASLAGALYSRRGYGDDEDAKNTYLHIIDVQNRTLGPDHPETILTQVNLAPLLTNEGDYEAAETIYRSALAFYNSTLGESDPNTIITMGALGSLLNLFDEAKEWMDMDDNYQANYTEAEELNRHALTLATIVFGASHHRTLAIMEFLGVSLTRLGQLEEAEVFLQDALKVRERESGKEHPDTIRCMYHLLAVLRKQNKHEAAREIRMRLFGEKGDAELPFRRGHIFQVYEWEQPWKIKGGLL